MEGLTPAQKRARAAYTKRIRAYADAIDLDDSIELPEYDLPVPNGSSLVTASYVDQFETAIEFLKGTRVPLIRYNNLTLYWTADSTDEVDRVAALADMAPEWSKNGQRYEAVHRIGPNLVYQVVYCKPQTKTAVVQADKTASPVPA